MNPPAELMRTITNHFVKNVELFEPILSLDEWKIPKIETIEVKDVSHPKLWLTRFGFNYFAIENGRHLGLPQSLNHRRIFFFKWEQLTRIQMYGAPFNF